MLLINKKGLSLIEVMITMGVMSLVSLALGNMFMEQVKSNNFLEDQLSKSQVSNDLKILTVNSDACKKTLSPPPSAIPYSPPITLGAVGTGQNLNYLRNNLSEVVLASGAKYNGLIVKQMRLINESIPLGGSSGTVRIEAPLERQRSGGGPKNFKPITQSLYVTIDPVTRQVTGCSNSAITPATVRTTPPVSTGGAPKAQVFCNADEIRLSCAGGRNQNLDDTCEEDDCGFIGVKPIDPQGCEASVDSDVGTDTTVWAICFKYM